MKTFRRRQDEHVRQIERQIQNDKPLDILTRLDLSASAVSVEVQTSQIENIQSLDFVRQVTVEQKIYPAEDTAAGRSWIGSDWRNER